MNVMDDGQLAFRALWQTRMKNFLASSMLTRNCNINWAEVDNQKYGNFGVDEFIITVDGNGKATHVEILALKTVFARQ
jgi:hypothetical protein